MGTVATVMSSKPEKPVEYCRYTVVKIDAEVLHYAKIAALMGHTTVQEWVSDLVNAAASKEIGKPPVKRKKPKPRPRPD